MLGKKEDGIMQRIVLALWLLAGPAFAQVDPTDPTLLPDDAIAAEAADTAADTAAAQAVAQVLATPAAQKTAIDLAMTRLKVPAGLQGVMAGHFAALLAEPKVMAPFAQELSDTFISMGVTPSNPDVIARMAGEQLPGWGEDAVLPGMSRLDADAQGRAIALRIRLAKAAGGQDCADYLSGVQGASQTRAMEMQMMVTWPAQEAESALALMRRAMVAQLAEAAGATDLTPVELSSAQEAAGRAIMAAVDATDDPARLYAAFGYPEQATAEDICTAHLTMLQAVQAMPGAEGALALRYLADFGLNG
jgi:hypothetical protein